MAVLLENCMHFSYRVTTYADTLLQYMRALANQMRLTYDIGWLIVLILVDIFWKF